MIITVDTITLQPSWIIVEAYEPKTGGISSSFSAEDKPFFGTIMNTGSDMFELGEILFFGMHSASTISINNKMYYLLNESDVIGVIKNT